MRSETKMIKTTKIFLDQVDVEDIIKQHFKHPNSTDKPDFVWDLGEDKRCVDCSNEPEIRLCLLIIKEEL